MVATGGRFIHGLEDFVRHGPRKDVQNAQRNLWFRLPDATGAGSEPPIELVAEKSTRTGAKICWVRSGRKKSRPTKKGKLVPEQCWGHHVGEGVLMRQAIDALPEVPGVGQEPREAPGQSAHAFLEISASGSPRPGEGKGGKLSRERFPSPKRVRNMGRSRRQQKARHSKPSRPSRQTKRAKRNKEANKELAKQPNKDTKKQKQKTRQKKKQRNK